MLDRIAPALSRGFRRLGGSVPTWTPIWLFNILDKIVNYDQIKREKDIIASYKIDDRVCCCDNVHRTIFKKEGEMAIMGDGKMFSMLACIEHAREDGQCHIPYLSGYEN